MELATEGTAAPGPKAPGPDQTIAQDADQEQGLGPQTFHWRGATANLAQGRGAKPKPIPNPHSLLPDPLTPVSLA